MAWAAEAAAAEEEWAEEEDSTADICGRFPVNLQRRVHRCGFGRACETVSPLFSVDSILFTLYTINNKNHLMQGNFIHKHVKKYL